MKPFKGKSAIAWCASVVDGMVQLYTNREGADRVFEYNRTVKIQIADRFMRVVIPVVFGAVVFSSTVSFVNENEHMRLIPSGVVGLALLIAVILEKRGKPIAAVITFIAMLLLSGVFGMVFNGGVYAPMYSATLVLLVLVGWFFSSRATLIFFIGIVGLGFFLATGTTYSWFRKVPCAPPYSLFFYMMTYQVVVLVAVIIGNRMLHRAIAELSKKEHLLDTIQESIGVGLITTGLDGHLVRLNTAAVKLLGAIELEHKHLWNGPKFKEPGGGRKTLRQIVETMPISKEHRFKVDGGGYRFVAVAHYPHISDNIEVGTILTLRDITERVTLEHQLAQSAKMEVLGQLAGGVVHDIKNNIGGIMGSADLIKHADESELPEYVSMIQEAGQNTINLANKLLGFSHKASFDCSPFHLNGTLKKTVFILERSLPKRIRITSDNAASNDCIFGFESDVQSIIMNLAINANHAMPQGGTLAFRMMNRDLSKDECELFDFTLQPGKYVELTVSDTGCGISDEVMERLFEPFFTTKGEGGTGLGLASVFRTMQDHHGAVTVSSKLGHGTTFSLLFPLHEGDASSS